MSSVAPGLQTCAACYCTKGQEIKSSPGENVAIQRRDKYETNEAAAGVTRRTVFQQTFFYK